MREKFQNASAVASSFVMGLMLAGCQTTGTNLLPKPVNNASTRTDTCHVMKEKGLRPGALLTFGLVRVNNTQTDEGCWTAKYAQILVDSNQPGLQAAASVLYRDFDKQQKSMIDLALAARGTSMEEVQKKLPQVERSWVDGDCLNVRYRLPENYTVKFAQNNAPIQSIFHPQCALAPAAQ